MTTYHKNTINRVFPEDPAPSTPGVFSGFVEIMEAHAGLMFLLIQNGVSIKIYGATLHSNNDKVKNIIYIAPPEEGTNEEAERLHVFNFSVVSGDNGFLESVYISCITLVRFENQPELWGVVWSSTEAVPPPSGSKQLIVKDVQTQYTSTSVELVVNLDLVGIDSDIDKENEITTEYWLKFSHSKIRTISILYENPFNPNEKQNTDPVVTESTT